MFFWYPLILPLAVVKFWTDALRIATQEVHHTTKFYRGE